MVRSDVTFESIGDMAVGMLAARQKLAAERTKVMAAAAMISKERLGQLIVRMNALPGTTLEQIADILLERGLEKF